ncbi:MAG: hypothetical protein K2N60_08935, partial [Oscillospiraceae bacterium]|nr:hypothetical protein [Oscillospiraceae bacterium]
NSAVYIRSAEIPESADEFARDQFEQFSESSFITLGLTSAQAKSASLGAGFRIKNPDGSASDVLYFYPIMCGDSIELIMSVSLYDGKYGCGVGKNTLAGKLDDIKTSLDNPVEIYASENGFYLLTDNEELHFSEGYPYSEATAQKELEEIKKVHAQNKSVNDVTVCFGSFEKGLVNADGKICFVNDDGTLATGWKTVDGKEYYFRKSGEAITKSTSINGVRYKFGKDGVCAGEYTGWTKSGGNRFYFLNGIKQTGWCKLSDGWHYFDEKSGAHTTGTVELYGKNYTFSDSGVWDGKADTDYSSAYISLDKRLPKDAYGGAYVDDGVLVIMTKDREKVASAVEKMRKTYAPIIIQDCKFSANELEEVRAYLGDNMKKYGLNSVGIGKNSVGITTEKVTDELQDYIDSLDDPDIISIEFGGPAIPDSDDVAVETIDCF